MTIPLPPLPKPWDLQHDDAGIAQVIFTATQVHAIQREAMRVALEAALKAGPPFEVYCGDDAWTIGNDHACKAWEDAIRALEIA